MYYVRVTTLLASKVVQFITGLQNMEPVAIRLVNDSPKIDGTTVSIEVSVSGPVNKVICSLDKKVVAEEDCKLS